MPMSNLTGLAAAVIFAIILPGMGCREIGQPMTEKELVAVIVDLHVLEARRELIADAHPALRDSILDSHGITHDRLRAAIEYYADRPDEYVSIYNQVIDSLSAEEAVLEEQGVIEMLPIP